MWDAVKSFEFTISKFPHVFRKMLIFVFNQPLMGKYFGFIFIGANTVRNLRQPKIRPVFRYIKGSNILHY